MYESLQRRLWRYINVTFPERQLYLRSEGRVQFFTFDPVMQAICAGAGLLFLGWVAFTSVNVIFKDRIIAAKERHFIQMQSAYEGRIADLQLSYDELNSALLSAEDHFTAVADAFETKQHTLSDLIARKQNLQGSLGIGSASPPAATAPANTPPRKAATAYYGMNMGGVLDVIIPDLTSTLSLSALGFGSGSGIPPLRPADTAAAPASTPAAKAPLPAAQPSTFLGGAVRKIGELFGRKVSMNEVDNPALRHIAEQSARISRLDEQQPAQLAETKETVDKEVARLTRILKNTGVDLKTMITRVKEDRGRGGPLIEISPTQVSTQDPDFTAGLAGAVGSLADLNDVVWALKSVPLTPPLPNPELSSGFGARNDPFTETLAYHTGLDFPGPKGTDVRVTMPGIVVYAARNGDYGNMVEVDHGNRVHTRYAHLSAIKVAVGAHVEKGDIVGAIGSTGRSTGPHLHYEVWYDNVVRDPSRFLKAGQDVLKN